MVSLSQHLAVSALIYTVVILTSWMVFQWYKGKKKKKGSSLAAGFWVALHCVSVLQTSSSLPPGSMLVTSQPERMGHPVIFLRAHSTCRMLQPCQVKVIALFLLIFVDL